jgi:hypothetical protein
MSLSNRSSSTPPGVIAAWFWFATALLFAFSMAWQPAAHILAAHDFEADEKECRQQREQEFAKPKIAVGEIQLKRSVKDDADAKKSARDYCVQRRVAMAAERQGEIAKWAAIVGLVTLLAAGAAAIAAFRTVTLLLPTHGSKGSRDGGNESQRTA